MLLVIDAGNTSTVVGLYALDSEGTGGLSASDGLIDHWRISTDAERTADELAVVVEGFLGLRGYSIESDIQGLSISSGVPRVTMALREMANRYLGFKPVVIEPGVRTGISILYENPKEVGADRIANAVAAYDLYGGPTIVVDFGTATTCDAVSADGEYLGGAIAPGIEISLDALFGRAAALRAQSSWWSRGRCWGRAPSTRSAPGRCTGSRHRWTGSAPGSRRSWVPAPSSRRGGSPS